MEGKRELKKLGKGAGTGLNDMFIGVFAVAFVLSLSLNLMHTLGNFDNEGDPIQLGSHGKTSIISSEKATRTRSALHQAMIDFKSKSAPNLEERRSRKVANVATGGHRDGNGLKRLFSLKRHQDDKSAQEEESLPAAEDYPFDEHNTHDLPPEIMQQQQQHENDNDQLMELATLDCKPYKGTPLTLEEAQEMVYWQEIRSDSFYVSPFGRLNAAYTKETSRPRYLTFEPDGGGWNNIRMSMESVIGMAVAMGRTLVMPPQKKMYLLGQSQKGQQHHFSFADFFPIEEMARDNAAFSVISMEEYLTREGLGGKLANHETGRVEFPPGNRTNWDGISQDDYDLLRGYLRNVSLTARWNPGRCLPAFPSSGNHKDVQLLQDLVPKAEKLNVDRPPKLDAPDPVFRLADTLAGRKALCVYDETFQNEPIVHFQMNHKEKLRLLVHFYAFLFFEDWKEDMWMKRFVRDHLRYLDEIQCAAARIVAKLRKHVKGRGNGHGDPNGIFDTFHIRRGDFQFKTTRISAEEIVKNSEAELTPNSTIFIATDERDKKYFQPLRDRYDIWFLDDFNEELEGVNSKCLWKTDGGKGMVTWLLSQQLLYLISNPFFVGLLHLVANYFGMIDQLVASKGRIFFGCFFSTFTGYIIRIRYARKERK